MLARDMDKMSVPFKEIHVCFYHNFKFYLCCELCGGGGGNNDEDYDGVFFSYDFYFVLVKNAHMVSHIICLCNGALNSNQ